jgi:hypothetical protein
MMRLVVAFVVVGCAGWAAAAQSSYPLTLPDGSTLQLGYEWFITEEAEDYINLESDADELLVTIYYYSPEDLQVAGLATLDAFARYDYALYPSSEDYPYDTLEVTARQHGSLNTLELTFPHEGSRFVYDVTVLYLLTPQGSGISFDITSYYDVAVGDITSVYQIAASYAAPGAQPPADPVCRVVVPAGIILRAAPDPASAPVRTIDDRFGQSLAADYLREDSRGAMWYHIAADNAYVRERVLGTRSALCDRLPTRR